LERVGAPTEIHSPDFHGVGGSQGDGSGDDYPVGPDLHPAFARSSGASGGATAADGTRTLRVA